MGCDLPIKAWYTRERNPDTGKRAITFNPLRAHQTADDPLELPCGKCMGCRLERARQWSIRIMHETQMHGPSSFVTLTYDDEHLPPDYSIVPADFQNFIKRFRHYYGPVRYYACGEYGEKNLRPHYHAILFGRYFDDAKHVETSPKGHKQFSSAKLTRAWSLGDKPIGRATFGAVTIQSAGYVARYTMKKIGGDVFHSPSGPVRKEDHYTRIHPLTGTVHTVLPEAAWMSRRPGIGADWMAQYKSDVFPSGFVVHDGKRHAPPRFYTERLTEEEKAVLKKQAKENAEPYKPHTTTDRRRARAIVRDARISGLSRSLE